ncbi:helix-turn-helix transcriptional regulator [Streptomyces noursei]|uniref:helix-turn-helix transcriptional regulator n=1 Tax=Streptomyces noursei TaxID=1971 RepID=UPI000C9C0E27|nr:helix-turn-helix transcriptional regulator [Streptomyces noursei]
MHIRDSQRFAELLSLHALSQRKIAELAHVSQAFISLLAHGRRGARPETAWRIASALGVFTEELFVNKPEEAKGTGAPAMAGKATRPNILASLPDADGSATHFARHRPSQWNYRPSRVHPGRPRRTPACMAVVPAA